MKVEAFGKVNLNDRSVKFNQEPLTIWMTGLSAAGKTTLAFALESELFRLGFKSYVLDGDSIRNGINKDLDFSCQSRSENIRRVAEIAHMMNDSGLLVICSLISPCSADRLIAKEIIGKNRFFEVYISTPLKTCEARDPKLLYTKARLGELPDFTGVSSSYEPPRSPNLSIDTSICSIDGSIKKLVATLLPLITLKNKK